MDKVFTLSIDEVVFKAVLDEHVKEMNATRYEILSKTKIFFGLDRSLLMGLLTHIFVRSPKRNTYVYQKGDINKNIYVIVDGEFEITCPYEYVENDFDKIKIGKETNIQPKNELKKNYKKNLELSLIKLGKFNYFGDEDGFDNKEKKYSIKVLTNDCKLFLIPKDVRNLFFKFF